MQLKKLQIRNFQSHSNTTLSELTPITVLVGPNGAGKSALFEGIRTFSRILTVPLSQTFGPPPHDFEAKLWRGANPIEMEFQGEFTGLGFPTTVGCLVKIGFTGKEDSGAFPTILDEIIQIDNTPVFNRKSNLINITGMTMADISPDSSLLATIRKSLQGKSQFKGSKALGALARSAGSVVRYRLEPRQIATPSLEPDMNPTYTNQIRIGYEGENLAACLFWLDYFQPTILKSIIDSMRKVIPEFGGFVFNSVAPDRVGFSLVFNDSRKAVSAPNASSGTLLILGLITLLNAPTTPDIVCIEEPEIGLTPDAVRLFFKMLCETASHSKSQFFFSSHSPFTVVDAWNGITADRSFIKRLQIRNGQTIVESLQAIIDKGESGAVIRSNGVLGLKTAEELICGRFLPTN